MWSERAEPAWQANQLCS